MTTDTTTKPPADPELAAFATQAAQLDAPAATPSATDADVADATAAPAPSQLDKSYAAATMLLACIREALVFAFQVDAPRRDLPDRTIAECARHIAQADVQTGGKLAAMLDHLGPWGACAVAIGPVAVRVAKGVRDEVRARKPVAEAKPATTSTADQPAA